MNLLKLKHILQPDDIISYTELVFTEGQNLQRGMNFKSNTSYSIFLMSVRKNAPYADEIDKETGTIIYEGHDMQANHSEKPKEDDQQLFTPHGSLTQNGKFYIAAQSYKLRITDEPHKIKVYEKVQEGVWSYKGFFNLVDAKLIYTGQRKVFKFYLQPVEVKKLRKPKIIPFTRIIPTEVKIEVYKRDKGKCVICGSKENLHYDHDFPFSKGGTSITAKNVRILCMKHNLEKSAKIMSLISLKISKIFLSF